MSVAKGKKESKPKQSEKEKLEENAIKLKERLKAFEGNPELEKIVRVIDKVNSIKKVEEENKQNMKSLRGGLTEMKVKLKDFIKNQNVKLIKLRAQQAKNMVKTKQDSKMKTVKES